MQRMAYSFLLPIILQEFRLDPLGIHGIFHWTRVLENGLRIAKTNGANTKIIELFALLHDSQRIADNHDPEHAARGAAAAVRLNNEYGLLCTSDIHLLCNACLNHSTVAFSENITIQTCWDADRLDLARTGTAIPENILGTEIARCPDIISWATSRSCSLGIPGILENEVNLFHGSPTPNLTQLIPNTRFDPGPNYCGTPAVYAADDPAYAAAHAFPWTTKDGIRLFFERSKLVLVVPSSASHKLEAPAFVYSVPRDKFILMPDVQPLGHNYCAFSAIEPQYMNVYDSVYEAISGCGGIVRII